MKVFLLQGNDISDEINIRPLSFNVKLEILSMKDNPISKLKGYKPMILRLLPLLYRLDDYSFSRKNDKGSYKKMYEDKGKGGYLLNNTNSVVDMRYRGYNDTMISKVPDDKSSVFVFDGSADGSISPKIPTPVSNIPWRNPPNPLPRPFKGKALFESLPYKEQLKLKMEKVKKTPKTQNTTQWMTPSLATKPKILLDTESVLGYPSDPSERKSPIKLMTTDTNYNNQRNGNDHTEVNDSINSIWNIEKNGDNGQPHSSIARSKQTNDEVKKPTTAPFVVKHVSSKDTSKDDISITKSNDDIPWHGNTKSAQLRAAYVKEQLTRENEMTELELSKTVVPTSLSYISQSRKSYNGLNDSSISLDLVSEAVSISEQVNASILGKESLRKESLRKESPYAMLRNLQIKLGYSGINSDEDNNNNNHLDANIKTEVPAITIKTPISSRNNNSENIDNSPILTSSPIGITNDGSDGSLLEGKQLAEAIKELMQRKQNTIEILQSARKKTSLQ